MAYVFDANYDSTTFGNLLATLEDPNAVPGDEFGASVGTTNTNIVIGAPGTNVGGNANVGAAYEFEGDTTQPTFGQLLVAIPSPDRNADSRFGFSVAGDGDNVIVGAPTAGIPGASAGKVYLFDGTTGPDLGEDSREIDNPDPGSGFGWAVASVGSNILIGSPDDDTAGANAGAAFLYNASGVQLMRFLQPGGGGGYFGTAVAGSENTALIGAPGADLGSLDAGAAYLFDADPSNPTTFGQAIAAEQEPTPTTGGAFGTSVSFDDGTLVAGAAARHRLGRDGGRGRRSLSARRRGLGLLRHHLRDGRLRLGDRERHVHRRQPVGRTHRHDRLG